MVNRARSTTQKISDFNVGSVVRTLLEAAAQEIDELYQQMLHGLIEAIGVSVYASFNFPAQLATPSVGAIRSIVTASSTNLLIAAGTTCTTLDGTQTFVSTGDVTIAIGATYGDIPVAASVAGSAGNLPPGTGFTLSPAPAGIVSASNLAAFNGGFDTETVNQRKARFRQFIQTLSRATNPSLLYALLQKTYLTDGAGNVTERVKSAAIVEPWVTDPTQPIGLVNGYIHNGVGSTSAALVAFGQQVINGYYDASGNPVIGYKAGGVKVVVAAATEQTIAVTAAVTAAPGYDPTSTAAAVGSAIYAYILGLPTSASYLAAQAELAALSVAGVVNYTPSAGGADVLPTVGVKLMPGALAITGSAAPAVSAASAGGTTP